MASSAVPEFGAGPGAEYNWTAHSGDAGRLSKRSFSEIDIDDEEALRWEALRRLPTYDRLRSGFLEHVNEDGRTVKKQVDLTKLDRGQRMALVERALNTKDQDNEILLKRLKDRINRFVDV